MDTIMARPLRLAHAPSSGDSSSTPTLAVMSVQDTFTRSPSSSASMYSDQNTMEGAGSIPTACESSSEDDESSSSASPMPSGSDTRKLFTTPSTTTSTVSGSGSQGTSSTATDMTRLHELEQKRLVLRHQRFSLEQRLFEFCGKLAEDSPLPLPSGSCRKVTNWGWLDPQTKLRVIYTGSLNEMDQPHGPRGRLELPDGQVYQGEVRSGVRAGQGRNRWPDGQEYVGEWKANSRCGRGTHVWPDGRKVCGQWEEGHLHGKVYFSWPNGATYDGTVRRGKKHGRGVHTWSDGRIYTGNFENGKEHGFGTLAHPDGVKYRGQFRMGVKEGFGIMLWKTRTYDGEWVQNKPEGQGRVVWSNGATYTGQFQQGKYHGLGVYVWPSGKKFVGRWHEGVKNGHGLYTWPNGKKYDGEYKDGLKHGYGRMTWPDGQFYSGGFENNQRSGRGILSAANGDILHCGLWKNDEPVGESPSSEDNVNTEEYPVPSLVTMESVHTLPPSSPLPLGEDSERDIGSPQMVAGGDDFDDGGGNAERHETHGCVTSKPEEGE